MANRILTMGPLAGSFILSEATMWRSRDEVFVDVPAGGVKSGTLLKAGATAEDPLTPVTAVADTAIAVLLFDKTRDDEAVEQTVKATVMARDCELNGRAMVWPEGATAAQKITMSGSLADAGIVVRW